MGLWRAQVMIDKQAGAVQLFAQYVRSHSALLDAAEGSAECTAAFEQERARRAVEKEAKVRRVDEEEGNEDDDVDDDDAADDPRTGAAVFGVWSRRRRRLRIVRCSETIRSKR